MFISRTINLKTDFSQAEAINLLKMKTEVKKTKTSDNIFVGYVNDDSFQLTRDIQYTNILLPIATGLIEANADGTKISAKLELSTEAKIFLFIWYDFLVVVTFAGITQVEFNIKAFLLVIPFVMGWLGLFIIRTGFNPEADTIEMVFSQLLKTNSTLK